MRKRAWRILCHLLRTPKAIGFAILIVTVLGADAAGLLSVATMWHGLAIPLVAFMGLVWLCFGVLTFWWFGSWKCALPVAALMPLAVFWQIVSTLWAKASRFLLRRSLGNPSPQTTRSRGKPEMIALFFSALIPGKHRSEVRCDMLEVISECREDGRSESWLSALAIWHVALHLAKLRCVAVVLLLKRIAVG
ncbi:MAG: hypothetical protein QM770_01915 [Tepidisphaeraceae bacterium]